VEQRSRRKEGGARCINNRRQDAVNKTEWQEFMATQNEQERRDVHDKHKQKEMWLFLEVVLSFIFCYSFICLCFPSLARRRGRASGTDGKKGLRKEGGREGGKIESGPLRI